MAHVVGAELHFIAVCSQRWGKAHDAGVGEEDVEGVEVGQEFLSSGFDGLERGLIALQECDVQVWGVVLSCGYYFVRSLGVPAGENDVARVMLCEAEDRSLANASGACSGQKCFT